ncbi:MAG: phosphoethanolamine--lipid A transferase [Rubrivivax sp.]|nr:phosphoethanolamine--lipid A transferase [Rubrivivax sp.]
MAGGPRTGHAAGLPTRPPSGTWRRQQARAWEASIESLILAVALFWTLAANTGFLSGALRGRSTGEAATWAFALALGVGVFAVHALLLSLLVFRRGGRWVLTLLLIVAAVASYYTQAYGVYLDPSMMRNVLRTDPLEARELLGWGLLLQLLLYAALPAALLWRLPLTPRPWRQALAWRLGLLLGSLLLLVVAVMLVFQPLSSLMRNQKELRYLLTPANVLWSGAAVLHDDLRGAARPREAIGLDAAPGPSWAQRTRPMVVLLVVGETARAANWGLSGYARQTTPGLAQWPVINFGEVQACGTNTEVSLPCMFAPVGRRDYDESRIRGQESLLHVVQRAGAAVHWRDNQSGCKGVCEGLPAETVSASSAPGLCNGGRCLDEALVHDLDQRLAAAKGTQLWVLHLLGSHGPAYFQRYPAAFARFQPACQNEELHKCTPQQIVNAYDNSLLYTDHVLVTALTKLRAAQDRVDSAMIYVSDHGESLGEKGLFLHGIPYAIAPSEQQRVPMVMWASAGLEAAAGLRPGCLNPQLQTQAQRAVSHDHLFHTVLGLLDVRTALHEPTLDMTQPCRPPAP